MLIWAAIAGALAGWAVSGWDGFGSLLGGCIGLAIGHQLRRSVRAEVRAALAPLAAQLDLVRAAALAVPAPRAAAEPAMPRAPEASVVPDVPVVEVPPPMQAAAPALPELHPSAPPPIAPQQPNAIEAATARLLAAARGWLLGGNTIVRVGLAILFVGLSFLASWAASAGLFPIELRLALVAAVGVALLVTGYRTRLARPGFGLALQGGGVAAIYLTLFGAARLFGIVPVGAAFALMIAVCALGAALALLQRSQALAVTAFLGGFAVPLLLGGKGGNLFELFGYYTLLNLAILGIAARQAWRGLNLTGFVVTFGLASLWGWGGGYHPADFAVSQGFLIASILIYLAIAVLFTRATPGRLGNVVDTTLLFGPALAGFGLEAALVHDRPFATAFAALGFAALYIGTALFTSRTRRESMRVMNEAMLAIGVGFVTLAVPLALGAQWTSAGWALEGAGAFWIGMRQARWLPRLFGLALQGVATLVFWNTVQPAVSALPFAHAGFVGAVLIALAWGLTAWWLRGGALPHTGGRFATAYAGGEALAGKPAFLLGFALWWMGWAAEAFRALPPATRGGAAQQVFADTTSVLLAMLAYLLSAWGAQRASRRLAWPVAAWPSYASLAVLACGFLGEAPLKPLLSAPGWAIWIVAIAAHLRMLYSNDARREGGLGHLAVRAAHVGGVWLGVAMLADVLWFAVDRAGLWYTSWSGLVFLASATAVLVGLTVWAGPALRAAPARWPLRTHAADYDWIAAALVAVLVAAGAGVTALFAAGKVDPLPYVPLLNPVDLMLALAVGALVLWRRTVLAARPPLAGTAVLNGRNARATIGGLAFLFVTTVWLRAAHHLLGVPWTPDALLGNVVVETGLAILWTLVALGLMLLAQRKGTRPLWLTGAALLGVTVVKLLLVDLGAAGSGARIVAFIGVGILMLVVGYAAPLPPKARPAQPRSDGLRNEEVPA